MTQETDVLSKLVPLQPLDLAKCFTVNDIVTGMSQCSFGARMLGEMADTLGALIKLGSKPTIISDLPRQHPLREVLHYLCQSFKWFDGPYSTELFLKSGAKPDHALVVGQYNRYNEELLFERCNRMYFVNGQYQCRPGQVRDGYFPNVVFADENLVLPVLYFTLAERLTGNTYGVDELMLMLKKLGGVAHQTVRGANTLLKMLQDKDSTNMFTVSGAMTVGKMQLLIADLIETGRIKYVAATGALMAHGLIEGAGCRHFKHDPKVPDDVLVSLGLNRVTDSIEPEGNFDHIEHIVAKVISGYDPRQLRGSHEFYRDLGRYIVEHYPNNRSILGSAFRRGVSIVTPANIDSELANDVFTFNEGREREGKPRIVFDSELDTKVLFEIATTAKRLGIFTIGGGVPRNNTQNIAPLHQLYLKRLGFEGTPCCYHYGVRIDPAEMSPGGLSGCTYVEGVSWGKFTSDGPRAEIQADATIPWPFIQRFALEKLGFYKMAA